MKCKSFNCKMIIGCQNKITMGLKRNPELLEDISIFEAKKKACSS